MSEREESGINVQFVTLLVHERPKKMVCFDASWQTVNAGTSLLMQLNSIFILSIVIFDIRLFSHPLTGIRR